MNTAYQKTKADQVIALIKKFEETFSTLTHDQACVIPIMGGLQDAYNEGLRDATREWTDEDMVHFAYLMLQDRTDQKVDKGIIKSQLADYKKKP